MRKHDPSPRLHLRWVAQFFEVLQDHLRLAPRSFEILRRTELPKAEEDAEVIEDFWSDEEKVLTVLLATDLKDNCRRPENIPTESFKE